MFVVFFISLNSFFLEPGGGVQGLVVGLKVFVCFCTTRAAVHVLWSSVVNFCSDVLRGENRSSN